MRIWAWSLGVFLAMGVACSETGGLSTNPPECMLGGANTCGDNQECVRKGEETTEGTCRPMAACEAEQTQCGARCCDDATQVCDKDTGACKEIDSGECEGRDEGPTCGNNNGSCNETGSCECNPGFVGPECQYSDATTCNSYGTAQEDGSCVCESNHYGSVCTTFCEASTTCNNNGSCNETGSCECSPGFVGPECQYSDATTCNSYGTAQEDGSCVCESNHYGSVCTTFCEASTTCNGNGVCDLTGSCSCSSALVISQFYAAGGNSGAVYNQKYVELHNRGTTPIVLDETWALQYAAAGATQEFYSGISLVRLEGTLEAGGYFLVYLRTQQSNGVPLGVDADQQTQVFEPSMTGGKLALVKTGSLLTGSACPTLSNPDVADFLLYGNAACPGGGEDKVASPSRVEAMARKDAGCMNTGSNGADFELVNLSNGANLPRNTQSPVASPCDCEW